MEELICVQKGKTLHFHAKKCGMTFSNIAFVIDWEGVNPALIIPAPLGIRLVNKILEEVKRIKS